MTHESLVNQDWSGVVARLGGAAMLNVTARERKAFLRPREITNAVDLLRLILAYCLGERGLRLTAAWATSVGLVDISSLALLYRLRQCSDWLAILVARWRGSLPRPDRRTSQGVGTRSYRSADHHQTQVRRASRRASGRHQEAGAGRSRGATQGASGRPARRLSTLETGARRRRLGYHGNLAHHR